MVLEQSRLRVIGREGKGSFGTVSDAYRGYRWNGIDKRPFGLSCGSTKPGVGTARPRNLGKLMHSA